MVGRFEPRVGLALIAPVLFAAAVVYKWDALAGSRSWRTMLTAAFVGSGVWAVLLAASDGWAALNRPVTHRFDAWAFVPQMPEVLPFLSTFTRQISEYPVHVQGHPPGLTLLLSALDQIGLGDSRIVAGLYIAAGASIIPAVLIAARATFGEPRARSAAPFLVLAPFALWVATSPDALFSAVAAWGVVLIVCARGGSRWLPFLGGAVFGCALMLTYGAAPLLAIPAAVWLFRQHIAPLLWAGAGILAVLAVPALFGFWWPEGLLATRERYYAGLGGERPYFYFVWANLATLAITIGPGAVRGLVRIASEIKNRTLVWALAPWPVLGALAGVLLANLSGLSKGEVERIWLLFSPWLVLAAGYLPQASRRKLWLGAAAAGAVALQALVRTPW